MREIKFRAWDNLQGGKFEYWSAEENKYGGIFWEMIKHESFEEPQLFTGYTGKRGKGIYEGDVVKINNLLALIEFGEGGFWFKPITDWLDEWNWADDHSRMEVVGNIYKNPELLDGTKT